jgi:hypothetical protein
LPLSIRAELSLQSQGAGAVDGGDLARVGAAERHPVRHALQDVIKHEQFKRHHSRRTWRLVIVSGRHGHAVLGKQTKVFENNGSFF